MTLDERYVQATADLTFDERLAAHSHLLGGLIQQIQDGSSSKRAAAEAIDRARAFAIRNRAAVSA